jgi:hypothetical protein
MTMRLSTLKGPIKGSLENILYGVLLLSVLSADGVLHIQGLYDLDGDGLQESLVLNAGGYSAVWVEVSESSLEDTLWSYTLPEQGHFNDAEIIDLDGDGFFELVATIDPYFRDNNSSWLFVFPGTKSGFSSEPISLSSESLNLGRVRPSNLTLIPGGSPQLGVSFGAPLRQAMTFDIDLSENDISLSNVQMLSAPIIMDGYGGVYVGGFISGEDHYFAMISPEGNKLKIAIFNVTQNFKLIQSDLLVVDDARLLLGASVQGFRSTRFSDAGLIIPYGTDDVFLLEMTNDEISMSNTNLSGKGAFPASIDGNNSMIVEIINTRIEAEVYPLTPAVDDYFKIEKEKNKIPPPVEDATLTLKSNSVPRSDNVTILSNEKDVFYKRQNKIQQKRSELDSLSPTLGDFLASVKKDDNKSKQDTEKVAVPDMNNDMVSVDWADEAGFIKVDLGEYIPDESDGNSTVSPIPVTDSGVSTFTETVRKSIVPTVETSDTTAVIDEGIDLYYVLAMTPARDVKDRYVFDGEVPFGIAVNQVPAMGVPTHFQHGISANLANLRRGETFDFAYSLRDAQLDSITTLTMVHDMQTNVVFMSISPQQDSLSQSYQPEAFDPKLFEFPDYFFEGFPTSLDMDFTDKLIRFSFDGEADTIFKGIYLSTTTPTDPSQSLAVFLDEGVLQAMRGEVVVRANGSKKITTEFDLTGFVKPSVMFSRLIQESFHDDLKIKLLQGTTLAEPLFGPNGKLPKITRKHRTPDAQSDQGNPPIPVEPKQSIIPNEQNDVSESPIKPDSIHSISELSKDENEIQEIPNVDDEQQELESTVIDSLKLDEIKPSEIDSLKLEEIKPTEIDSLKLDEIKPSEIDSLKLEEIKPSVIDSLKLDEIKPSEIDSLKLEEIKPTEIDSKAIETNAGSTDSVDESSEPAQAPQNKNDNNDTGDEK